MPRSRWVLLTCAFASLAACRDIPSGPKLGGYTGPLTDSPAGAGLVVLEGVLEMMDDEQFALRQADRLVPISFAYPDVLPSLLGKEIRLFGKFVDSGAFAVTRWQLAEDDDDDDDEDAMRRVPAPPVREGKGGSRR